MGSPYLNSGETIILTTNRVSADAVTYDVMLTSERLFLIDNQNERFEPGIIPLAVILSVQGGKTPAHDPVITLLFRSGESGGERQPLNLVFSQNPGENRKPERDDWMRGLIQLSINQHEREVVFKTPMTSEASRETGLRPSVRHGIAPEKVPPLSNVVDHSKSVIPVTVIPDEAEGDGEIPVRPSAETPTVREIRIPEQGATESDTALTPVRGTPPSKTSPPSWFVIPQIVEELLPAPAGAASPDEHVPEPLEYAELQGYFLPTAAGSVTDAKKPAPEQLQDTRHATVTAGEEVPGLAEAVPAASAEARDPAEITEERLPAPEQLQDTEHATVTAGEEEPGLAEAVPTAPAEARDPAEITGSWEIGAAEPVTPAQTDTALQEIVPDPGYENLDAGIQEIAESPVTLTITDNTAQDYVSHPEPDAVFPQEPAAQETPPPRHPAPPAREIRPFRTTLIDTAVLLLIVALVAAGAVLVLSQGSGRTDGPVIPTQTLVEVITLPPETLPLTTVPAETENPTATRVTPTPSLPASPIPQTGVWVRVNSTAPYIGSFGNPGLMQPVSGTGDYFFKVLRSDRPVQVSVQKQDNSGALLSVAIYRDGSLMISRSVTSPKGTLDLLIDPTTARAPGLTENDTLPEHAAKPTGLENY